MTTRAVHCAAVDLGATSGRVIVGAWSGRHLNLTEVHRFANQFRRLSRNEYWDLPYLWDEVRTGLARARQLFPSLASVGVDSWAVDHVLLDPQGRLVHPVYAYRDTRTQRLSEALGSNGIEEVYAQTGVPNYPYNTSLQLKETIGAFPALIGSVARCLFISDYFNYLLSGRFENELSIASHSQLIDVRTRNWSAKACAYFGVPRHWFGKAALSPQVLGPVTGLPKLKGVQSILVPGHDTACAFAAMPADDDGSDMYLSSGTWSLMGFENNRPVLGLEALAARISNERMGDGRYRPLRSCLGLWLLEQTLATFTSRPAGAADWARLMAAAESAPPPVNLLDIRDSALFNPPDMRVAIAAQLRRRGARPPNDIAGYVRLITDSLGKGHADSLRLFERLTGRTFKRILVVGGGSKNRLLCQATATACGVPVVSYSLEGSAVGNIACQLVALGEVKNLQDIRVSLRRQLKAKTYHPGA